MGCTADSCCLHLLVGAAWKWPASSKLCSRHAADLKVLVGDHVSGGLLWFYWVCTAH